MSRADELVRRLDLKPHPEGGFYRETFRSARTVETQAGARSAGTSILYLLSGQDVSRFHRIDSDEIWFFHQGGPLLIYSLEEGGITRSHRLSEDNPQVVIEAGIWFGAVLERDDDYALVGCAVAPGFEFSGFELADREELMAGWPDASDWIEHLT